MAVADMATYPLSFLAEGITGVHVPSWTPSKLQVVP